jgi:GDP-mannose transporter
MVLSNKALAASFPVQLPIMLVLFQCILAVILGESCRAFNVVQYKSFEIATAAIWLPVNVCFVLMLLTSFMSFKYLNVPMITVFKNLTNVIIVFGDWYWHQQKINIGVLLAFGVMVVGAVAAAYTDIMFSAEGYFWMSANCAATASYVLYMRSVTTREDVQLSKFEMVFYNNLLSIPLLLPVSLAFGEFGVLSSSTAVVFSWSFISVNLVAGSMGFFLNLASLWCVGSTSATTYALVGSVNKIPVSLLGMLLFDAVITAQSAAYIAVSMAGGFIYTYVKLMESRAAKESSSSPSKR